MAIFACKTIRVHAQFNPACELYPTRVAEFLDRLVLYMGAVMRKPHIIGLMFLLGLAVGSVGAADVKLDPKAPDRYIVVPGDTLWDISGRFLRDPWRWPQLFEMNRDQIRNPHLIYPGDVIVLDRASGRARLISADTVRLSPKVRIESRESAAVPSIPTEAIEPFLSKPRIMDEATLAKAPRIVATEENRVVVGAGSRAYARGIADGADVVWQVFRPGEALVDPDTKEQLGYEAIYLGDARVIRPGEVSVLEIIRSNQEMNLGDRMFPAPKPSFTQYVPRAPEKPIKGRVLAAYGGLAEVGQNAIVTLNKGIRDGLAVGHVLALYRSPESTAQQRETTGAPLSSVRNSPLWGRTGPTGSDGAIVETSRETNLPVERHGLLFVFRTFDKVSYGLVMQSTAPVHVMDYVQNP